MIHLTLAVALALAADKPKSSATEKDAIKSAIAVDSATPAAAADGGTAAAAEPPKNAGPDVSKMSWSPENIKAVVAYYQPQIQNCYEETLAAKDKAVEGTLKTKWVITPQGLVTKAEVLKKGTTLKDPKLHGCVITVLSAMSFPKPSDGKNQPIEFPFNLKAVH
jgi:hypothetical protein